MNDDGPFGDHEKAYDGDHNTKCEYNNIWCVSPFHGVSRRFSDQIFFTLQFKQFQSSHFVILPVVSMQDKRCVQPVRTIKQGNGKTKQRSGVKAISIQEYALSGTILVISLLKAEINTEILLA